MTKEGGRAAKSAHTTNNANISNNTNSSINNSKSFNPLNTSNKFKSTVSSTNLLNSSNLNKTNSSNPSDKKQRLNNNLNSSTLNNSSSLKDDLSSQLSNDESFIGNNLISNLDKSELNRRLAATKQFNIDLNDLKECTHYDEELRLNNIENLEAILNETKNKLTYNNEKDGYWCFKRKEGCKYLPVSGTCFLIGFLTQAK